MEEKLNELEYNYNSLQDKYRDEKSKVNNRFKFLIHQHLSFSYLLELNTPGEESRNEYLIPKTNHHSCKRKLKHFQGALRTSRRSLRIA